MKKNYCCQLFVGDNNWANDAVRFSALSNGGKYIPLKDIATAIEMDLKKYPTNESMTTITIVENKLLMDVDGKCLLEIEEREVYDLEQPSLSNEEAKEVLSSIPTLDRQGNGDTGVF